MSAAQGLVVGVEVVHGDLLDQVVDALVNPWNRNFVPRRTGSGPWRELSGHGLLAVGDAVVTGSGDLGTARWLVHVAGLTGWWRATETSVRLSTINAVRAAHAIGARTVAMPLIGAGTGGMAPARSRQIMLEAMDTFGAAADRLDDRSSDLEVRIVVHANGSGC